MVILLFDRNEGTFEGISFINIQEKTKYHIYPKYNNQLTSSSNKNADKVARGTQQVSGNSIFLKIHLLMIHTYLCVH